MLYLSKQQISKLTLQYYGTDTEKTIPKKYYGYDVNQFYIACNTWIAVVNDLAGEELAMELYGLILAYGIKPVITGLDEYSNVYLERLSGKADRLVLPVTPIENFGYLLIQRVDDIKDVMQCLRFLKRLTPNYSPSVLAQTEASFWDLQRELGTTVNACSHARYGLYEVCCTNYGRRSAVDTVNHFLSDNVLGIARGIVSMILGDAPTAANLDERVTFGSGVAASGAKTFGQKLGEYCYTHATFLPCAEAFGELTLGDRLQYATGYEPKAIPNDEQSVSVVPKTLTKGRIIAPQPASRQPVSRCVMRYMVDRVKTCVLRGKDLKKLVPATSFRGDIRVSDHIPLSDQEVHRLMIMHASVDRTLATVDSSSASDRISRRLVYELLSNDWIKVLNYCTSSTAYDTSGKLRRLHTFALSGSAITFVLESIIHYSLGLAAMLYQSIFVRNKDKELPWLSVYGDDVLIDRDYVDILVDVYSLCHLKVNNLKTYGDTSHFLESCGAEYYRGYEVSSEYFPRKALQLKSADAHTIDVSHSDATSVCSLIALQHRLYGRSVTADVFIRQKLGLNRVITTSVAGAHSTDLWGAFDIYITETVPRRYRKCKLEEIPELARTRQKHTTLKYKGRQLTPEDVKLIADKGKKYPNQKMTYLFPRPKSVPAFQIMARPTYERYKLSEFIKTGPSYDSGLDRILGVSMAPKDLDGLYVQEPLVFETANFS